MPERFQRATVTLTPLSPLHISAGKSNYGAADLVVDGWTYLIDEDLLARQLQERGLLDAYLAFFEATRREKGSRLVAFLEKSAGLHGGALRKFAETVSLAKPLPSYEDRTFIRDGNGDPYIPGSSLKGAIRTALLWAMLKDKRPRLNDEVRRRLQRHRSKQGLGDIKYLTDLFDAFTLEDPHAREGTKEARREGLKRGPHTDFMKALSFSDSSPIPEGGMSDMHIKVLSLTDDNRAEYKRARRSGREMAFPKEVYGWYVPADDANLPVPPSVTFTATLDRDLLNAFSGKAVPFKTLEEVWAHTQRYAQAVWEEEKRYLEGYEENGLRYGIRENSALVDDLLEFYEDPNVRQAGAIRLGYGSGLLGATLFTLLDHDLRRRVRDLITPRRNTTAPKSRRVLEWGDGYRDPLGWAALDVDYEDQEQEVG